MVCTEVGRRGSYVQSWKSEREYLEVRARTARGKDEPKAAEFDHPSCSRRSCRRAGPPGPAPALRFLRG